MLKPKRWGIKFAASSMLCQSLNMNILSSLKADGIKIQSKCPDKAFVQITVLLTDENKFLAHLQLEGSKTVRLSDSS